MPDKKTVISQRLIYCGLKVIYLIVVEMQWLDTNGNFVWNICHTSIGKIWILKFKKKLIRISYSSVDDVLELTLSVFLSIKMFPGGDLSLLTMLTE